MMVPAIRSFVAVPLPEEIRADVFAAAQELGRELPGVRWSRKLENLHVTIKFLGQVAEERLGEMGTALARAIGALPRFVVEMRGLGAFPSPRQARVIWAGVVDPERRLSGIADAVEAAASELGIADRESRLFRAHVTVGRAKGKGTSGVDARAALGPFADRPFGRVPVDEVRLYESQLGGDGSTYVLRSRAALNSN